MESAKAVKIKQLTNLFVILRRIVGVAHLSYEDKQYTCQHFKSFKIKIHVSHQMLRLHGIYYSSLLLLLLLFFLLSLYSFSLQYYTLFFEYHPEYSVVSSSVIFCNYSTILRNLFFSYSSQDLLTVPRFPTTNGITTTFFIGQNFLTSQVNLNYHSTFLSSVLHTSLLAGDVISLIQHSFFVSQLSLWLASFSFSHCCTVS